MEKITMSSLRLMQALFGPLGMRLNKGFSVREVEPGLVEFRCRTCRGGFETDTKSYELMRHARDQHGLKV